MWRPYRGNGSFDSVSGTRLLFHSSNLGNTRVKHALRIHCQVCHFSPRKSQTGTGGKSREMAAGMYPEPSGWSRPDTFYCITSPNFSASIYLYAVYTQPLSFVCEVLRLVATQYFVNTNVLMFPTGEKQPPPPQPPNATSSKFQQIQICHS